MDAYGTPESIIPLNEAAAAIGMMPAELEAALGGQGRKPIVVTHNKRGVRPQDLETLVPGASQGLAVVYSASTDARVQHSLDSWDAPMTRPLTIGGAPVTAGQDGVAYAGFTLRAMGGRRPYTFELVGTWPAGITVDAESGEVSGTPSEDGAFEDLSVRVTDGETNTADLDAFTLTIEAAA